MYKATSAAGCRRFSAHEVQFAQGGPAADMIQESMSRVAEPTLQQLQELPEAANNPEAVFRVDEATWQQLEKLCEQMTNTNGLVMAVLEMALTKQSHERTEYFLCAKKLATRGAATLKRFLWLWAGIKAFNDSAAIPEDSPEDLKMIRLAQEAILCRKAAPGDVKTGESSPAAQIPPEETSCARAALPSSV